jgi:hypothetical protein
MLGNERPQFHVEQKDAPANTPAPTPPPFCRRATNQRANLIVSSNSARIPGAGNTFLRVGHHEARRPRIRLAPGRGDAKLPACQERAAPARSRAQGRPPKAQGHEAPNAQAKGLTRRPSNTGVPHWRETMRSPGSRRRRDRPPKGQAEPAHRRCNLSGKADSEGIQPPHHRKRRNCLPSKEHHVH